MKNLDVALRVVDCSVLKVQTFDTVRVYGDEGTPVPIPNTVVKLINGENTWLETARENNTART